MAEPSDGSVGASDKPTMAVWVDRPENHAHVGSGASRSEVGVIRPQFGQPYLRTYGTSKRCFEIGLIIARHRCGWCTR
jgi:hypothetical protein